MGLSTFIGGVHPFEGKELSADKPIQVIQPKGELVFPLSQHIGAPAKPLVAKGDAVLVGQKLAEAGGFISANVICSVSGTVKGIEPRLVANGSMVQSIIVESDGEYRTVEGFGAKRDYAKLSKQEIRDIVKEAGIVGLGGAGFPTNVKLSPKNEEAIDYIIVNAAECEPYLTSDYRRMIEEPEKLVEGLKIILRLFDNAQGILAVEDNKPDCVKILTDLTRNEPKISVAALKTKYPQGAERQIIYATTGREINSSMLPADAGCVVDNVDTIVAVYHAVKEGKPLMNRIVTVTGDAVNDPRNFYVRIGMNYKDLIDEAGGLKCTPEKIVSGGPMMGFALFDLNVPTTKTASALLCLTKDEVSALAPTPCINCGRCVEACPSRLVPTKLAVFSEHHDEESFVANDGMECVECGCCSYMCPAKRHLTQSIKSMRKNVLGKKKKA